MKADASVVDLHKLGPHYYELGQHLLPLAGPEAAALASLLTQVGYFKHSFKVLK